MPVAPLLNRIADAFVRSENPVEDSVDRLAILLGRRWGFLTPLVKRYFVAFPHPGQRRRGVVRFLLRDPIFKRVWQKRFSKLQVTEWLYSPRMHTPPAGWDLPRVDTVGDLAAWLEVTPKELEWYADLKGITSRSVDFRLAHYHRRLFVKRSGGLRLVEAPKRRLREMQRVILAGILDRIPPHPAAHGFVKGRSIHTFIAPHIGKHVVLKMDLRDFFPSLSAARIQGFFRLAGYSEMVADSLGGLTTTSTPKKFWSSAPIEANAEEIQRSRLLYSVRHVPQGAPTSPALSNLCAYRLDCRLAGLAQSAGAQYTRYADDLAFSGDSAFARSVERFATHVAVILAEEGFAAHHRKTRVMHRGVRQHVAGLTVNQRANAPRRDFDHLKAILTNCARYGPSTQNRERHPFFRQHLEGRVAFMESVNFEKAGLLRGILTRIDWQK